MKSFPSAPRNYRVAVRFSLCTLGLAALAPWHVAAQTPTPAPASDSAPTVATQVTAATAPKEAPVRAQDIAPEVRVSQDGAVTILRTSPQKARTSAGPATGLTRSVTIASSPVQAARAGSAPTIIRTHSKVTTRSLSGETQTTPSAAPGYPFAAPGMIATTPTAAPSQQPADADSRNVTIHRQTSRNAASPATAMVIRNGRQTTISRIQSSRAGDAVTINTSPATVNRITTSRAGDTVTINTSPATVNRVITNRAGDAVIIDGSAARISRVTAGRAGDSVSVDAAPTVSRISTSRAGRGVVIDGASGTVSRITSARAGSTDTIDISPAQAPESRVIVVPRDSSGAAVSVPARAGRGGRDAAPVAVAAQTATYHIEMRLVRYQVDAQGKATETVVITPSVLQKDNSGATVTVIQGEGGYTLLVTPHHDTDSTVMLNVEVRELGEQGEVVRSGKNVRSIKLGESVHITGMTDATDKALRRAVMRGEIVTDHGAYSGYYVEVKATLIKPASAVKP